MELDGYKRVIVVLGGVITSDGKKVVQELSLLMIRNLVELLVA